MKTTAFSNPTNGAKKILSFSTPYIVKIILEGTSDIIFHRWNCEEVEAKSKAAKGSNAKKEDNIESYIYRNESGEICIPGEYLRQSIIHAGKYEQDPRSPRKSAMDILKAAIISNTELMSLGKASWDYEHKCRVVIQKGSGITRTRPAIQKGWVAECELLILLPEYIDPHFLNKVIVNAGRLVGLADFRPTYGRFMVRNFEPLILEIAA